MPNQPRAHSRWPLDRRLPSWSNSAQKLKAPFLCIGRQLSRVGGHSLLTPKTRTVTAYSPPGHYGGSCVERRAGSPTISECKTCNRSRWNVGARTVVRFATYIPTNGGSPCGASMIVYRTFCDSCAARTVEITSRAGGRPSACARIVIEPGLSDAITRTMARPRNVCRRSPRSGS